MDKVEERSPEIVAEYREKLEMKVNELLADTQIEESRIASEVVLFADKICIIITHDLEMASIADTSINLSD